MIEYIYFVKCPNCEDEHFDFFNDAKDFALGCIGQQPIITQVEVDRNDFGECTDSRDLGTIWSWEEMIKDEPVASDTLSKKATLDCVGNGCYDADTDPEFTSLDNSLDSPLDEVPDNFRKPVPAGMTVEDLVEEMEKNEDTVECSFCSDLYAKTDCQYEERRGYLCKDCVRYLVSIWEPLKFKESCSKQEAFGRDPFDHHDPDYDEDEAAEYTANLIDGAKDARYDDAIADWELIDYD